jgi:hypothetical protein
MVFYRRGSEYINELILTGHEVIDTKVNGKTHDSRHEMRGTE